jgi:hypothetical protein
MELFLLGHSFAVVDADGRTLPLESWLWSDDVRELVLAASPRAPERSDGSAARPHP